MRRFRFALVGIVVFAVAGCDEDIVGSDDPFVASVVPHPSRLVSADAPRYTIEMLDVEAMLPPDLRVGVGGTLNDRGMVTAQLLRSTTTGLVRAGVLIWDTDAGSIEIVEIEGVSGLPLINDAGQLAGTLRRPAPAPLFEPFIWTRGSGLETLGFTGQVLGLNHRGQVVGYRITEAFPTGEAFFHDPADGVTMPGVPAGESSSRASGINQASVVVGTAGTRPFSWAPGTELTPLDGDGFATQATAINDRGEIVGVHFFAPGATTGAYWASRDASRVLLPCAPPFEACRATDINNRGEILGTWGDDEAENPMVWLDGVPYDLRSLIEGESVVQFAHGINDRGQIGAVGVRIRDDGTLARGLAILTPIASVRTVRIDVKPNSDPSSFNLDGIGSVPAAVLGEPDFDTSLIDARTLLLNGLTIASRGNGDPKCGLEDVDGDGYADLVCHFEDNLSQWTGPDDAATLTGRLRDGTEIEGTDAIRLTQ